MGTISTPDSIGSCPISKVLEVGSRLFYSVEPVGQFFFCLSLSLSNLKEFRRQDCGGDGRT